MRERHAMSVASLAGTLFLLTVFQDALLTPIAAAVGEGAYLAVRRVPDFLAMVVPLIYLMTMPGRRVARALPFVVWFSLVAASMLFSGWRNGAAGQAGLELGTLARCWPLFLAIVCQEWEARPKRRFVSLVLLATTVECFIGLLEVPFPSLSKLLLPGSLGEADPSLTYLRELPKGYVSGTFIETVGFAYASFVGFLVLATAPREWLPRFARRWRGVLLIVHAAAVFASGSATVVALMVLTVTWRTSVPRFGLGGLIGLGAAAAGLVVLVLAVWGDALGWDSFVRAAQNQRLGILASIRSFFASAPLGVWLTGLGPSDLEIWQAIRFTNAPAFVMEDSLVVQDVYWFAVLLFYGLLGLAALWGLLTTIWLRASRNRSISPRELDVLRILLVSVLIAGLLKQVLEFRPMAFFLWPLAGMLCQTGRRRA